MALRSSPDGSARAGQTRASYSYNDDEIDAPIVAEINITPLTDIFLVLLIIFMVTTSVTSQLGVDVQLPQASAQTAAAQSQPEGVIVTLLPDGKMRVNQQEVSAGDFATLEKLLKVALAQTSGRLVVLEGDRQAFLGSAVQVMDYAKRAGAEKFAIATQP